MTDRKHLEHLFSATIDRYGPMIQRVCRTYASEPAMTPDLYQEVLASLWVGLKSFRGLSSMSTWVYRISINVCISYLRRNRKGAFVEYHDSIPEKSDESPSFGPDEYECLKYLIGQLSPTDKAIALMWLDERSYNEISDVTGLSHNAVGTRMTRIRERLHKLWERELKNSIKLANDYEQ